MIRRWKVVTWSTALASSIAWVSISGAAGLDAAARLPAAGHVLTRPISSEESHRYDVSLSEGQFLDLLVEQRGIDVAVILCGPDGYELQVDRTSDDGPEPLLFLSQIAGVYTVEVKAFTGGARSSAYDLKVRALGDATEMDRQRVAAELLVVEGEELQAEASRESLQEAVLRYEEALPLYRMAGDAHGQAITFDDLGRIAVDLGEPLKALDHFNHAIDLFREAGDEASAAATLNNVGGVYDDLGEEQKALDCYVTLIPIFETLKRPSAEAVMLNNVGYLYQLLGDSESALDYFTRALSLRRSAGQREGEAITLDNIGRLHAANGAQTKALDCFSRALSLYRAVGDARGEGGVLTSMGWIERARGDPRGALASLSRALSIFTASGDRRGEASSLLLMGEIRRTSGDLESARTCFHGALELARAVSDRSREARALAASALLERDAGDLASARSLAEAAIEIDESSRTKVASFDLRASYFASKQDDYDLLVGILMSLHGREPEAGYDRAALDVHERARARSLMDLLAESHIDVREGIDPEMLDRERALVAEIDAKEASRMLLLADSGEVRQVQAVDRDLQMLLSDYRQVQAQVRLASPRYASLTQPTPLRSQQIQQQLDDDTLLVEYSLGEPRSYLWAVTRGSTASYVLPGRRQIEELARRAYELMASSHERAVRVQSELAAAKLARVVLGPLVPLLDRQRLLIVADGALQYIPFAALPVPDMADREVGAARSTPLIADHEIVHLPSASVIALLRDERANRERPTKGVAVLADPVLAGDDPRVVRKERSIRASLPKDLARSVAETGVGSLGRLTYTRSEADAIASIAGEAGCLEAVDFEASRALATSGDLSAYRILHFATHALIDSRHPELSGVVLSLVDKEGRPLDGFLRLHDIYNMKLSADLVALSACQTALGQELKGEGLIGMTRGFMYAGAPCVVASLWSVRDQATAELMKRFYEAMLKQGMRPVAALRQAQLSLMKESRWQAPYYWAGFIVQGDWE